MATLQTLENGTWTAVTSANFGATGKVRYYRWQGVTADGTAAQAIDTKGARIVYAYLGTLNSGTLTAGNVNLYVNPDAAGISAAPDYITTTAGAGRYLTGTIHGTTEASNVVAIYRDPPSSLLVNISSQAGTLPDYDIIIEVHY